MSINQFFKKLPIPMCGLILGLVSLGNLLVSVQHPVIGETYCLLGFILMLLVVSKLIFTLTHALQSLHDPIVASVSPTFTMAWMVLCVFFQRLFPHASWVKGLWLVAVGLHFVLMIYFVVKHIFPVSITMQDIYPSWFITFVGIGVIPNTASNFYPSLGPVMLWVALFLYFLLLPVLIRRGLQAKQMPEGTLPLLTIIAAPGSLCLAGYLSAGLPIYQPLVVFMLVLSQLLYVIILVVLTRLVRLPFYPSYAAFTFPLVISATAVIKVQTVFPANHWLSLLGRLELSLALLMVSYVTVRYLVYLFVAETGSTQIVKSIQNKKDSV